MKKAISLFLSFLMVAMLLPYNTWALELSETEAFPEETFEQEIISEEKEETLSEEPEIIEEEVFVEQKTLGAGTIIASGECNSYNTVGWSFKSDGTLSISGVGEMDNYTSTTVPWAEYRDRIKNITIGANVENIGNYAFYGCTALEGNVTIPNSVKSIGIYAFYSCIMKDGKIDLGGNYSTLTKIGSYAFKKAEMTGDVWIPASVTTIGGGAFDDCTVNDYYFRGDAPTEISTTSFDIPEDTLHYVLDKAGWVYIYGKWNGYNITPTNINYLGKGTCGNNITICAARFFFSSDVHSFINLI